MIDSGENPRSAAMRVTTTACELAELYLQHRDAANAVAVAHQGLHADPLNAALTEILMSAYSATGELSAAQQVFESHDRSLSEMDLGGASDETRRVFERLCAASNAAFDDAVATAS